MLGAGHVRWPRGVETWPGPFARLMAGPPNGANVAAGLVRRPVMDRSSRGLAGRLPLADIPG
jgi:hypothetical protein